MTPLEILPAIDLRGGKCVRLRQGDYNQETVFGDDPAAVAAGFVAAGATRIHVVDLDAAKSGARTNGEQIKAIVAAAGNVPVQLGGGVRDDAAIDFALNELGVDRTVVGSAAVKNPDWFATAVEARPGKLVLGLDYRGGEVATDGWTASSGLSAVELAKRFAGLPLGAAVCTDIADDGMMAGISDTALRSLAAFADLGLPVIASGGVSSADEVRKVAALRREHPNVVGAIVGRAIYEGALTVEDAIAATL
ncbi:1-(5-phosphoribosyl)-5-[(5-phosphoribosylamino)methylideneamino]imidazole-4-carboxamide isomerase [Alienimonas californiensis]|uniref:1-(5-phosphoribosyl)-5-[(5-phosphoribosylamino)methylideneamino] imidazole-4-carboxamide isomerase n=1 Tax=Alienimonas californiensis TaxID=2527989 RepID=A0A517PD76_9PLAN|nr:1-(5-phosphoribosyl)-5-[(5-phosphoribosylamino)methylideneamino] imidazole-4-carboxamide isomerase [Alienimonas californiensis]QDT17281.1 1-(5-phosphoribosyl)-5-[(5-phosphoribosylamino)methylideneamino] imidazole-4-carboxamide isomerase [Alienimonas californiensis]